MNRPAAEVFAYATDPPRTWGLHGIGRVLVPLVVRREASKEMPANLATLKRRMEVG